MSDFNISYSLGSPPDQSSQELSLYSFNDTALYPSASGMVLAQPKQGGAGLLLQQEVAHALGFCRNFRTLDAHLDQILSAMPPLREHAEDTRQTLVALRDNGLLESSEVAWQRLTQGATASVDTPCGVCILTCDRPAALNRLLTQLCAQALPAEIDGIWVIDDSRQAESMKENAAIVDAVNGRSDIAVVHFDSALREKLIQHLATEAPDTSTSIDWLLSRAGWQGQATYGQARNFALLLNVGQRLLMLDDDILPEAIAPPLSATSLQFSTGNHREAMVWDAKDNMAKQALPVDAAPARLMLGNLGAPLAKVLSGGGVGHASLSGVDGNQIAPYHANSKILISQAGSWGDPGTGDTGTWLSFMPDSTVKRLLEHFDDLEGVLGARAGWVGYRGPSLTPYGIMSAHTGLDHSTLLPPYFPAGRGEDILFGIMTQRLHPDSLVLNEGWAIRHDPIDERVDRVPLAPLGVSPSLSTLGDWLGREPADQWGLTPERRLAGIAEQIQRLSEMNATERESLIHQELASKRASLLQRTMDHMGRFSTLEHLPGFPQWQSFIEASRDQLLAEIQNPAHTPLEEWANQHGGTDAAVGGGKAFAQALRDWPEICAAAQTFSP